MSASMHTNRCPTVAQVSSICEKILTMRNFLHQESPTGLSAIHPRPEDCDLHILRHVLSPRLQALKINMLWFVPRVQQELHHLGRPLLRQRSECHGWVHSGRPGPWRQRATCCSVDACSHSIIGHTCSHDRGGGDQRQRCVASLKDDSLVVRCDLTVRKSEEDRSLGSGGWFEGI